MVVFRFNESTAVSVARVVATDVVKRGIRVWMFGKEKPLLVQFDDEREKDKVYEKFVSKLDDTYPR